jgi:hypothetical protein
MATVRFDAHPEQPSSPANPKRPHIVAEEEDSESEDVIPGPNPSSLTKVGTRKVSHIDMSNTRSSLNDSSQNPYGNPGLASRRDLDIPPNEFAEGCKLLQAAALGHQEGMDAILSVYPKFVNFRDYDRRTALHVAASEGHLEICKFLVSRGAKINRSDRWGGSPLDDASRNRYTELIAYLRSLGATSGSANNTTNFIKAAADGDYDEVLMYLEAGEVNIDEGDYDKRTALHLAAGEGNNMIVELLCDYKANVNVEDRWGNRPLDDAERANNTTSARILRLHGATLGKRKGGGLGDSSTRQREIANLEVQFDELEMIERIGKGSFGEIYKCR